MSQRLNSEILAGILFVLIGAAFLGGSVGLSFGSLKRIGPAGFPTIIATCLILMGLFVVFKGMKAEEVQTALHFFPMKLGVIILSIIIFGLTVRGAGLIPAVALCSLVASLASKPVRLFQMAAYGLFLGALCGLAFVVGLGMPVQMIGPWISF